MGNLINNKVNTIVDKMEKEGKVHKVSREESSKIFNNIDNDLRTFRRELSKKEISSNTEAAKINLKFAI